MSIKIFKRAWWRKDHTGKLVPNGGGRRTHVKFVDTEREAINFCNEGNANRPDSWLKTSIKYEWTKV